MSSTFDLFAVASIASSQCNDRQGPLYSVKFTNPGQRHKLARFLSHSLQLVSFLGRKIKFSIEEVDTAQHRWLLGDTFDLGNFDLGAP
jgi:hypothetical protein